MCHQNRLIEAMLMSTRNIPFTIYKKENLPKLFQICSYGIFSKGLKKFEFETAMVNEPSVFEPLKFHCSLNPFHFLLSISPPFFSNN